MTKIDVHDASTSQAPESSASMFQMPEVMQNLRSDSSKSSAGKSREELERIAEKNSEALLQKDLLLQENSDKITSLTSQVWYHVTMCVRTGSIGRYVVLKTLKLIFLV